MIDYKELAEEGRNDLYVFSHDILGYDKLRPIHVEWCRWAMDLTNIRRLRLAPRDTYKSTVLTISFALWLLIQTRVVIRGVHGYDLRILVANAVDSRARDFLAEMDGHMSNNPCFRRCYGDLVGIGARWTQSQKTISTRKINRKEPSLQSVGKGGQLTSAHYDIALIDDIVSNKDRDGTSAREATKKWVQDLASLVHQDGLIQMTGTHWHYEDHYHYVIEDLNKQLISIGEKPYEVVVESAETPDGQPTMPDLLPATQLARLKVEKGSYDYAAQYLNKPTPPESQLFLPEQLSYYDPGELRFQSEQLEFFGYCDPSLGKTKKSDFSAILTLARHRKTGELYLDGADLQRRTTEQIGKDILKSFFMYPYKIFGYEANGFQDVARKEVERRLAEAGVVFNIKPVDNNGDKVARIQAAEFKIKAVKFREDCREAYPEFMRQLFQFPDGANDDGPDAMESCLRLIPQGRSTVESYAERLAIAGKHAGIGSFVLNEAF